jgi:hypothetical protein
LRIYRSIRLVLSLFVLTTNNVQGMLPFRASARIEHAPNRGDLKLPSISLETNTHAACSRKASWLTVLVDFRLANQQPKRSTRFSPYFIVQFRCGIIGRSFILLTWTICSTLWTINSNSLCHLHAAFMIPEPRVGNLNVSAVFLHGASNNVYWCGIALIQLSRSR